MIESCYLAGKMQGCENLNCDYFYEVAKKLRSYGFEVISPAEFKDPKNFDWYQCLRRDVRFLAACDAICLLPGWKDSCGASLEYRTARDLGLEILFWDEETQLLVKPKIIGIGGYAHSGKDSFAKQLTHFGFTHASFAHQMKRVAFDSLPEELQQEVTNLDYAYHEDPSEIFDGAKKEPKWREYLQRFGTEGIRNIDKFFWVRTVLDNLPSYKVAISDVRFKNELEEVKKRGGVVVWMDRPGVGPVNEHSSDNSIDASMCDTIVENDGLVDDLYDKAQWVDKFYQSDPDHDRIREVEKVG